MATCPDCGSYSYDEARFCVQCGARLRPQSVEGEESSASLVPREAASAPISAHPATQSFPVGKKTLPGSIPAPFVAPVLPESSSAPSDEGSVVAEKYTSGDQPGAPAESAESAEAAAKAAGREMAERAAGLRRPHSRPPKPITAASASQAPVPSSVAPAMGGSPRAEDAVRDEEVESALLDIAWTDSEVVSQRPEKPQSSAPKTPTGKLMAEVDHGFAKIVSAPGPAVDSGSGEVKEVRELFSEIAAEHMRPVRDFMLELKMGDPPREWIEMVLPAMRSLHKSGSGMGLTELCEKLEIFVTALEVAAQKKEAIIGSASKDSLLGAYEHLVNVMPGAFRLDAEKGRREPIIVQSLLRRVPGVRKVALDKLYAAGLTSLQMYFVAKPDDIAAAADLPLELAARIIEQFRGYRKEVAHVAPERGRTKELAQLKELAARLADQNTNFEAAGRVWTSEAKRRKRVLRQERSETLLEINVLLARLGEVELVSALERLPFSDKAGEVMRFLEGIKQAAEKRERKNETVAGRP